MRFSMFAMAVLILPMGCHESRADEPAAKKGTRVVEGRIVDAEGRPPAEGKVFFGPQVPPIGFLEKWSVKLDAEGHYRVELADSEEAAGTISAGGALRFLAIAPGFRAENGKVAAGAGPSTVDLKLTPEAWKETEILVRDRDEKAVPDAVVDLSMGGGTWSHLKTDPQGRCRASTAPGVSFGLTVHREGYLTSVTGFRGTADDPIRVTIPLLSPILGRVVDPAGKPLPGVKIGRVIAPNHMASDPEARVKTIMYPVAGTKQPAITDADGRFTLSPLVRLDSRSLDRSGVFRVSPQTLCVADEGFQQVVFAAVDGKGPLDITLRPARRVRIPIEHEVAIPSGEIASWWELTYLGDPSGRGVPFFAMDGFVTTKSGEWIESYWPEGKYRIKINSADSKGEQGLEETQKDLAVPPGGRPLTLPTIRLSALLHHRLIGQPAPEIDAKDLDTGKPVKLADFKGKVVVLDFWGYWCGPCVGSMPELIDVHRRYKDRPVVILSLHDQSIQSREAYDRKLSGIKKALWDGQDLPFLVALDRPIPGLGDDQPNLGTGVTCKRYEIQGFPTTLVIDADGKVAGTVNALEHGKLEAMIKGLLDKGK